jgi:hypothetical protein
VLVLAYPLVFFRIFTHSFTDVPSRMSASKDLGQGIFGFLGGIGKEALKVWVFGEEWNEQTMKSMNRSHIIKAKGFFLNL